MTTLTPLSILLVEDQTDLASNIAEFLEQYGCIMDFAYQGHQGLNMALTQHYDVVILDLTLPGMDGLHVCEQLREQAARHIPVLMLTARETLQDKVKGFQYGADDYLTKPFALEELYCRVLALSRRTQLHTHKTLELGELRIDKQRQQVFRQDQLLTLSTMSYRILMVLIDQHPQVVTRSVLCQKLWGDNPTESDSLRSHIYQLRQQLDKPFRNTLLKTVHGVGFHLALEDV